MNAFARNPLKVMVAAAASVIAWLVVLHGWLAVSPYEDDYLNAGDAALAFGLLVALGVSYQLFKEPSNAR